jgi:hypothetical protein
MSAAKVAVAPIDIDRKIESCGRCNSSPGTSKRQVREMGSPQIDVDCFWTGSVFEGVHSRFEGDCPPAFMRAVASSPRGRLSRLPLSLIPLQLAMTPMRLFALGLNSGAWCQFKARMTPMRANMVAPPPSATDSNPNASSLEPIKRRSGPSSSCRSSCCSMRSSRRCT